MASYSRRGDAWWIRWKERKPGGGYRSRSRTIRGSERDAQAAVVEVERELEEHGAVMAAVEGVPPASLLGGMQAMIDARVQAGRWKGNTPATYTSYMVAVGRVLHELRGIPTDQPLPVTLLSRGTFHDIAASWARDGRSPQATYGALRLLLEAWRWMANEPGRWAHVPRPPFDAKDYLPAAPSYARTEAPTLAHVDAMIRRLDRQGQHPETLIFALVMRYTGLRGSQVQKLRLEDLNLAERVLVVEHGKSQREQLARRVVPIAAGLLEEPGVRALLSRASSGPVFRGRGVEGVRRSRKWLPQQSFRDAWELATELDQVPREVWDPPQRRTARPTHALRAALQGWLLDQEAPGDVVDFIVGHKPKDTRGRHYGRAMTERAREWVDRIPRVSRSIAAFREGRRS